MLLELTYDFTGPKRRPCAKIIYSRSLRTVDRLEMHELIVKILDEQGMAGTDFSDIVIGICNFLLINYQAATSDLAWGSAVGANKVYVGGLESLPICISQIFGSPTRRIVRSFKRF